MIFQSSAVPPGSIFGVLLFEKSSNIAKSCHNTNNYVRGFILFKTIQTFSLFSSLITNNLTYNLQFFSKNNIFESKKNSSFLNKESSTTVF